jgi:hypothetical protein
MGKDRLNVTSFLVRAVGFVGGDTVYAADKDGQTAQPCLILWKEKPADCIGELKVAPDCRIRVSSSLLKLAGLPSAEGTQYDVDGDNGKITIKSV